jgi:hypothetical protein
VRAIEARNWNYLRHNLGDVHDERRIKLFADAAFGEITVGEAAVVVVIAICAVRIL